MESVFVQIGVVTILAAVFGLLAKLLRQPIILAYIIVGIFLGSGGFHLIDDLTQTHDIAAIGIVFLLFLVGLELDIAKVRKLGSVILITGLVQMISVTAAGYAIVTALGYPSSAGIYLGLACAFSSTAVVLKRLADRRDLAALYAKITIGILLLQDVLAIIVLMVISGGDSGLSGSALAASFILKGGALFLGTWLVTRYVLGRVFYHIAKSTELLFLTSIAWAFLFALVTESLGFSKEIGAFLAGLSLASLPYNLEIMSRVKPLKDFFLIIFFVLLGLEVSLPAIVGNATLIAALAVLVVFGKSLVTSLTMVRLGYPKRPAYLTGAGLGQMSEFSLLILLLALSHGHVSSDIVAVVASLMVITITLNTYWNDLNRYIYPMLSRPLTWFASGIRYRELTRHPQDLDQHILLFGANHVGYQMLKTLERLKKNVLVVDHNPEVIKRLLHRGVQSVYGDIDDFELLHEMGLSKATMVISTVPNVSANLYLIEHTRASNEHALVITTAEHVDDALNLYASGADYVILPKLVGGEQAAKILENVEDKTVDTESIRAERGERIKRLKVRRQELAA